MKKYLAAIVVTCTAMFSLSSCSKSAPEMLADTMTDLSEKLDNPKLTEEEAVAAFADATGALAKIAKKIKSDPAQAKMDFEEFEKSGKAGKLSDAFKGSKVPEEVMGSHLVQVAATFFRLELMLIQKEVSSL